MTQRVSIGRYAEARRRVFRMLGEDAITLDTHAQLEVILEDLTLPEMRPQLGYNTWSSISVIAAVAAQQPELQLLTPTDPFRMYVVEGVAIISTLASEWSIGRGAADAALGTTGGLNTRYNAVSNFGAVQARNFGAIAAPAPLQGGLRVQVPALGTVIIGAPFFPMMFKADPAFNVMKVLGTVVNNTATVSICGYDRPLSDLEL